MSTPGNTSNGPTPTGPNGAPLPPMRLRRAKNAGDPLVRPKRRPPVRPPGTAPGAGAGGAVASKTLPSHPSVRGPAPLSKLPNTRPPPAPDARSVNGFSGPLLSEKYVDYPLVTTRKALREGLKHHIARFSSKKAIDPRDESQFTRPVRLHRRDPRARAHENHGPKMVGPDGRQLDENEREAAEARKAAREKERAENMAQIAPSVGSTAKRPNAPKQKIQQVFKSDMTKEEIARARIKYEEALPWHLEDFNDRNVWVGNYEAALSENHAVIVFENNKMRMIPAEKWYKFTAKQHFKALTIEEAEKIMSKRIKDPRWFMEKQKEIQEKKELESYAKVHKVYAGKTGGLSGREGLEASEMDFEEDRFADDEEHADLFNDEQDEDTKAAERRIKEDQLKANVFDLKNEKDYEDEEEREKKEREARRTFGKKVRKALKKRERNFDYSSGSDANPYTDEESSDDSEAERQKEEEKRKAEEEKAQKEKEKDSATSTKGSNTPSGRPKHTDALKKPAASRKRLGSPGSDASGTDTSRKKAKNKHQTSQPTSRPMSPSAVQTGKKRIRDAPHNGSGSGSEVDVDPRSGNELGQSAKIKKIRLNLPSAASRSGTPQGSRATSPVAGHPFPGSRAASPDGIRGAGRSTPIPSNQPFPTPAEIHAAIPATGISSSDLLRIFRPRIGESKENHRRFIAIVKDVGLYGKEDRLLRPGTLKPT
ncbi:Uncharacterized protein PECH_000564 [Penicillium ucsense]|uniref:Transcription initiation factor IIF subunit alpha n=1 Tax=Penicillium ucsense TaxID=2839758 RepID=A0A8J8VXR5_9EURO|nr:Uncharacterized protein PECM_000937 [Penicillium ucsense]KAF7733465.1 Uncharacterized protein PECH_000564 [Penicillium ucsense]